MPIAEMIEQLSFGRSIPRLDVCLGLYLSPDVLFLAELQMSGSSPKVTHLLRLPLPPGKDTKTVGSLNTEFLADQERVGAVLSKAMSEVRWKAKHVVVSLSHHFGILRYFTLPPIDRRFWKTAVPAEAKKYIPIPFSTLAHDFQIVPMQSATGRRNHGALFGVTDRKNLTNLAALLQKAGLTLMGVELAPCSVERLWDTLEESSGPYVQVHFDEGDVRILISDSGVPIFFREVFLGSDASAMDRRKVDLAGCVDFTKKQLGSSGPAKLRLSGKIGDMEAWKQAFSQDLGLQTAFLDVDKPLGLRGGQWGGYAALGACLRYMVSTPLNLDLGGVGRISDEDRRAATTLLSASALVAAFFVVMGLMRYGSLIVKRAELAKTRSKGEVLEAFRGKSASEIEKVIASMQEQVNSFGVITTRQVPLTHLLAALAEVIPEPVWVTSIRYENPLSLGAGKRASRKMELSGHTMGANRGIEQDLAFHFTEALGKHPKFKEVFPSIEQSVEAPSKEIDDSPDSYLNDPTGGDRTRYEIRCAGAKGT